MYKYLRFIVLIFILFFLFSCASQGYPKGGIPDKSPPVLKSEIPLSNSSNINIDESIILIFDELLKPESIYSSINIEPDIEFNIKHRLNRIILSPKSSWPLGTFKIHISKKLSDYNNNFLDIPINLIYSTSDSITYNYISGKLYNFNSKMNSQILLLDNNLDIQTNTQIDSLGNFEIFSINDNENFLLVAVEGEINNKYKIEDLIKLKRYGISNTLNNYQNIYLSEPAKELKLIDFNFINNYYAEGILDDNTKLSFLINYEKFNNLKYNDNHFIYIDKALDNKISFEYQNNVKKYDIEYKFSNFQLQRDTVAPGIENMKYENNNYIIDFTEPIQIKNNPYPFYEDSSTNIIAYEYFSPKRIIFKNADFYDLNILCQNISDLNGNLLCDSTLIIQDKKIENTNNIKKGELEVSIINGNLDSYIIQLVDSNNNFIRYELQDKKLLIKDLIVGDYTIMLYEDKNALNQNYFSGQLNPIKLAAKFNILDKPITVRANWTNSIVIDLKGDL